MTDESVDLCRVRKALTELDRLAAKYPDRLHQGEPWIDNLEKLDEAMGTPATQRMAQYRERKIASGMKEITLWCPERDVDRVRSYAQGLSKTFEKEMKKAKAGE